MSLFRLLLGTVSIVFGMHPLHAAGHDNIVTFHEGLQAAVFYPPGYAEKEQLKKWPAMLFSHGFAGSALSQDMLLQKIAGLGILVMALEHSDPVAFARIPPREGDSRWKILSYMREHPFDASTYAYRPAEFVVFAREAVKRFPINEKQLIFAGHSMGGYTIINAVERLQVESGIKPLALISYSTGELNFKRGHPYFSPQQLAGLKMPLLVIYGEDEFDADKGPYAERIKRQYGGDAQIMMLNGGSHLSYNDPKRFWGRQRRLEGVEKIFQRTRQFLFEVMKAS
jgi:pimeloyl-ACP methyl ester carboxylesterase